MRVFQYSYEVALVKYFQKAVPGISEVYFVQDLSLFRAEKQAVRYPACAITRSSQLSNQPKTYDFTENVQEYNPETGETTYKQYTVNTSMCTINYVAKVYFENEEQCLANASVLRFFLAKNPKLNVRHSFIDSEYAVEGSKYVNTYPTDMFFDSVAVVTDRGTADLKGAQRYVELHWHSDMVMDYHPEDWVSPDDAAWAGYDVESVRIFPGCNCYCCTVLADMSKVDELPEDQRKEYMENVYKTYKAIEINQTLQDRADHPEYPIIDQPVRDQHDPEAEHGYLFSSTTDGEKIKDQMLGSDDDFDLSAIDL